MAEIGDSERESKILIGELIRFHNSAKGVFFDSKRVFSICILIVLFGSMGLLACSIFQLEMVMY